MMTAGASLLSTALGVAQQMQRATSQRGEYNYLAAQQQARLAAQGTDLLGSPLDVLGDLVAAGGVDPTLGIVRSLLPWLFKPL